MDFHQLRVFIEVARQKSFSRAAESIFLTQPTVSAHIKALENEIGTPLLDRSQRELQLTEAGNILFQYAQQLLGIKEKALSSIQAEYQIIQGQLEIAASSVPGAYLLPGLMLSFRQQYPEVTFSVLLRDTKQVLQSVNDFTYDLGFVGEPVQRDGLEQVKLIDDELVLIAAPQTPFPVKSPAEPGSPAEPPGSLLPEIEISSCLDMPFLMREPGSATRMVFEKALKKRYNKNVRFKVIAYLESQEAIKEAVKAGLGLTVISRKAVEEEISAGSLAGYRLLDINVERHFYLIFKKNRILPPLSRVFLDHCTDYFNRQKKQEV